MIYFYTPFFTNPANGPAKFARLLREALTPDTLTIITSDIVTEGIGFIKLPSVPKWVRSSVLTQLTRARILKAELLKMNLNSQDTLVLNNIICYPCTLTRLSELRCRTVGFINDDNNISIKLRSNPLSTQISRRILRKLEVRASHAVNCVVVNSQNLADKVSLEYGVNSGRIKVLYKGTSVLPPRSYRQIQDSEAIKILFVKSDWRRGGLLTLLDAAIKFRGERHVVVYVIGVNVADVPHKYRNSAIFLGLCDASRVQDLLQESDIFCVPASAEALGVANIEAMMASVPVIATSVGGIPEVTNHGINCWEVPVDDEKAIRIAINSILSNPRLTARRVADAYTYVSKLFSSETTVNNFTKIAKSN